MRVIIVAVEENTTLIDNTNLNQSRKDNKTSIERVYMIPPPTTKIEGFRIS